MTPAQIEEMKNGLVLHLSGADPKQFEGTELEQFAPPHGVDKETREWMLRVVERWFVLQKYQEGSCIADRLNTHKERMLKWFDFTHTPEREWSVRVPFALMALQLTDWIDSGPERTVALRKLLESKDSAVRAMLNPGG